MAAVETRPDVPPALLQILQQSGLPVHYHLEDEITGSAGPDWREWQGVTNAFAALVDPSRTLSPVGETPSYPTLLQTIDVAPGFFRYAVRPPGPQSLDAIVEFRSGSSFLDYLPASRRARIGTSGLVRTYENPRRLLDSFPPKARQPLLAYSWDSQHRVPMSSLGSALPVTDAVVGDHSYTFTYQARDGHPISCCVRYDGQRLRELAYRDAGPAGLTAPALRHPLVSRVLFGPINPSTGLPTSIELQRYQSIGASLEQMQALHDKFHVDLRREYWTDRHTFRILAFSSEHPGALALSTLPAGTQVEDKAHNLRWTLIQATSVTQILH